MRKEYIIGAKEKPIEYFCVTPVNDNTTISIVSGTDSRFNFQYSTNGKIWYSYTEPITTSDPIYFKGINDSLIHSNFNEANTVARLSATDLCDLSGCISSLIAGRPKENVKMIYGFGYDYQAHGPGVYSSAGFFGGSNTWRDISNLKIDLNADPTSSEKNCAHMFSGQTHLINTCKITGTLGGQSWFTLSDLSYGYCYQMYEGCTALTTINPLPTDIKPLCYADMFRGCTALTSIPDNLLPSTSVALGCYYQMFCECTSLVTMPRNLLPATTLAESCYQGMFGSCTSLEHICVLPATTLAEKCYQGMFYNNFSLREIPALYATVLPTDCYTDMFRCNVNTNNQVTTYLVAQYGFTNNNYQIPYAGTTTSTGNISCIGNSQDYSGNYITLNTPTLVRYIKRDPQYMMPSYYDVTVIGIQE